MVDIFYAKNIREAIEKANEGYEPVECSFGREGSVVGKYVLDHHGEYSKEKPVSIKAAELKMKGVVIDKFVVTGSADCDQCYAIACLDGSDFPLNMEDAYAVGEIDIDPIGKDFTSDRYKKILLFNQRTSNMPNCLESTIKSISELKEIFKGNYTQKDIEEAIEKEKQRKENVKKGIKELEYGKIALANSETWGFDVWYESAPIVVAYVDSKKSITIGLCPKKGGLLCEKSGFDLLGQEGLKKVFPKLEERLGPGWGGRETVGGSPRNVEMKYEDAQKAYNIIKEMIS